MCCRQISQSVKFYVISSLIGSDICLPLKGFVQIGHDKAVTGRNFESRLNIGDIFDAYHIQ